MADEEYFAGPDCGGVRSLHIGAVAALKVLGEDFPFGDPQTKVPGADQVVLNESDIGEGAFAPDDRDRPEKGKSRPWASLG
jgi:hypothetical protein